MSRLHSSSIYYPIIPTGEPINPVRGIKDAVLNIYEKGNAQSTPGYRPYKVSLIETSNGSSTMSLRFKAVIREEDMSYVNEILFIINKAEGIGSAVSTDGRSFLFVDMTELSETLPNSSYGDSIYIVEPCCVRWHFSSVSEVILANEERISDINDRKDLRNTAIASFAYPESLKLYDGYNVSLRGDNNMLSMQGNPGEGRGLAPYNPWEDKDPPDYEHIVLSINGQPPDEKGNIKIESSDSVSITVEDNSLLVSDNSHVEA